MADFSIISDVSNEVLKLLRENICPELIQSPESIALAAPTDKNADFQLGLYLYDIQELREYQNLDMIRLRGNQAQYPPKPLNLFFALYMNTKSQMMSNVENEQRILGRAMQVLMDHAILYETAENDETSASITLLPMSYEEKTKIWSVLSIPYQLGIYFSVAPVLLIIQKNPQLQACGSSRIRCFPETAVTGGPYDSDENGVCPAAGGRFYRTVYPEKRFFVFRGRQSNPSGRKRRRIVSFYGTTGIGDKSTDRKYGLSLLQCSDREKTAESGRTCCRCKTLWKAGQGTSISP